MTKRSTGRSFLRTVLGIFMVFVLFAVPLSAADNYSFAHVKIGESDAFMISDSDSQSAAQRAEAADKCIKALLKDPNADPSKIDVRTLPGGSQAVALQDSTIIEVSPIDSRIFGRSQSDLAMSWASILRTRMTQLKPLYMKAAERKESGKAHATEGQTKPLADEKVMLFLIQVSLLLTFAVICGEIMARLGQPAVIGQLLAGIVLGPSVLGAIFPQLYESIFPIESTQQYLIDIVSWLGVIFLLMLTGTETDLGLIKAQSRVALATSLGGTLLPLLTGFAVAFALPEDMLVLPEQRLVMGAFLGTVFSVSSVTVIAKILMEMKLLRRNIGQAILASSLVQDLGGCVLLAVVAALAGGAEHGPLALIKMPVGMALFVLVGATLGRHCIINLFRWVNDRSRVEYAAISLVIVVMLLSAAITQFIGVHVILGAFAIGVVLAQSPLVGEKVLHPIEAVTMGIFTPVFFAAAGLHVNLTLLKDPKLLLIAVVITLVACVSKIAGSYFGGSFLHLNKWESLSIGFGTNARGAMGLIVGILGFSLGILTVDLFTVIVLMSLVSTAIAPFLLHFSLPKIPPSADEIQRLEKEEQQARSFVSRIKRVLLPVKAGSKRQLSGRLLSALGQHHAIESTALTVYPSHMDSEKFLSETLAASSKEGNVTLINRNVQGDNPSAEIVKEAELSYDLIVLESMRKPTKESVFGPTIDAVAKSAPCPLLILRESATDKNTAIKTILIPTTGRWQTGTAAELGVLLAKHNNCKVISLFVVEEKNISFKSLLEDEEAKALEARDIVEQVSALAAAYDVQTDTIVRTASDPSEEILRVVRERQVDLLLLGVRVRPTRRLFLGNTVKTLVEKAPCHLAVLSP